MNEKREGGNQIGFHWDGISFNIGTNTYSFRLGNIPTNLSYLVSPFSILSGSLYTINAKILHHFNAELSDQHYIMQFNAPHPRLQHMWKVLLTKNSCNLTDAHLICEDGEYARRCFPNIHDNYVYDRVIKWKDAELWRRWLEPANKTFEDCVSSVIEIATPRVGDIEEEPQPQQVNNSDWTGRDLATLGFFALAAGAACKYAYSKYSKPKEPILGKANISNPPFSERIEGLTEEVPNKFKCPVSWGIMNDPILLDDGHIYDRQSIVDLLKKSRNAFCPLNPQIPIVIKNYPTILGLKSEIEDYVSQLEEQTASLRKNR